VIIRPGSNASQVLGLLESSGPARRPARHPVSLRASAVVSRLPTLPTGSRPTATTFQDTPMQTLLIPFFQVLDIVLDLYSWAVIIAVIMSWLINFNVINRSNQLVRMVMTALDQLVEPALRRIRRLMPNMGGLDLSPIVLLLAIYLVRQLLFRIELLLT
jgi:YggT family protein